MVFEKEEWLDDASLERGVCGLLDLGHHCGAVRLFYKNASRLFLLVFWVWVMCTVTKWRRNSV